MRDSISNKALKLIILGVFIGGVITYIATTLIALQDNKYTDNKTHEENKPLYWVAPMDANYRKDKPGKSPMGMDLVPVYKDVNSHKSEDEKSISISASVINNLGVRTSTVAIKKLNTQIKTVGYVTYDEDKLIHIHPRVQGWIEKLHVKSVGQKVTKNDPLYDIYSPELVNAQKEFLLVIDSQNKQLISAAENRLLAFKLSKNTIQTLKESKQVQQNITFYSPQNGVVENLKIREGFYVEPGSTLMSIGDLSVVWVEAEIFEKQVAQVKTGDHVKMTLDYLPGKYWKGQVDYVHPTLDEKTRTMKVRLRFHNRNNELKPNMFAQISINTTVDEKALVIPKEALIRTGLQDRVVLALGKGRFKSVEVVVGRYDHEYVEITSGLNEGDSVVSSAQFLLDSESSKTSDFKRMSSYDIPKTTVSSATVTGTINTLMIDHGMVNISRAAIPKWNRPAATLDFITADGVNLEGFSENMKVKFTFEIHNENFVIINIHPISDRAQASNPLHQGMVNDHVSH